MCVEVRGQFEEETLGGVLGIELGSPGFHGHALPLSQRPVFLATYLRWRIYHLI